MYVAYSSPVRIVPDHIVRAAIMKARLLLRDGSFPAVEPPIVGWKRSRMGQLTAVVSSPWSGKRFAVGLDVRTGRVRVLGPETRH